VGKNFEMKSMRAIWPDLEATLGIKRDKKYVTSNQSSICIGIVFSRPLKSTKNLEYCQLGRKLELCILEEKMHISLEN
jgi:hypothetical protein